MNFLWVAIGGMLGSVCRYGIVLYISELKANTFLPYGTILVNVLGCLVIGLLAGMDSMKHGGIRPELRLLLMVGFLGGFTTFSSFGLEFISMIKTDHAMAALLDVFIQLALGFLAVAGGYALVRMI